MGREKIRDTVYHALHSLLISLYRHLALDKFPATAPQWEFQDLVGRLKAFTSSDLRIIALEKFALFRNHWAHEKEPTQYTWTDLSQSFAILEDWFEEMQSHPPHILSDHIIMTQMAQSICSMAKTTMLSLLPPDKDTHEIPQLHGYSINSEEDEPIEHQDPLSNVDPEQFVWCSTVAEHRADHAEAMKGRSVMILDGKNAGRTGVFVRWDSSKCIILLDVNNSRISLSSNHQLGVLRDTPKASPSDVFVQPLPSPNHRGNLSTSGKFALDGSLDDIRRTHKDWIIGRDVVILSGKLANCTGKFDHWTGTTAYITTDTDSIVTSFGKDVHIGVLR